MVIDLSNKVIGVGRLHKIENELGNVCAQIRYMAVSKDFQKKGLGTKILTNLEKYAFNDNISEIMLHSRENAIDFYKKNGYEVIKKTHILYNSIQHWLMSKNNNNLLRLESIIKSFPNCLFLIPFRDPIQQANSLLLTHQNFSELHKKNNFIKKYMRYLVHYEFGANHMPQEFSQNINKSLDANSIALVIAFSLVLLI